MSHETRDEALACLATIGPDAADEVLLVDCGSTDGTVAAVRASYPDVTVVPLRNVGYGRGANAGIARTSAPFVVVANADTRFGPGTARTLADVLADDPGLAAAGPLVRYPDGRLQASARRFPTLAQAAGHALLGLWWPDNRWTRAYRQRDLDPALPRDVDWLSGCAVAIRREAFAAIGGFDPGYFMYVEDVDLGYRLRQAGWRLRYAPDAVVVHVVGASTGRKRIAMVVEHARSLDRFYGRVYGRGAGRLVRPFVRLGLLGWVGLVITWGTIVGRGRSTTGE